MSDFCSRFEYIRGKKNQVADLLSRYIPDDADSHSDEEREESIDHIKQEPMNPIVMSLDANIISKAQKICHNLKELYTELEKGRYITGYKMFKDMIFIRQGNEYMIYMPDALVETALMLAHSAYESGHTGIERTLQRLKRKFYFKKRRKLVEDYCQQCHICQTVKGNNPIKAKLGQYPLAETPFEKVAMDVLGPLTRSTQ